MTQPPTKSPAVSERVSVPRDWLETMRRREVQRLHAAFSTRDWHAAEKAGNELRDKIDSVLHDPKARLAPAPEIVVTEGQRERALAAGRAIVHGQGDGTYDEATVAIHLLLAALGESQRAPEKGVRRGYKMVAEFNQSVEDGSLKNDPRLDWGHPLHDILCGWCGKIHDAIPADPFRDALERIASSGPKEKPGGPYDEMGGYCSDNLGDVIAEAQEETEWRLAEIARAALAQPEAARVGEESPPGMKVWAGGDGPPADWDRSGPMKRRSGAEALGLNWRHHKPGHPGYDHDIIAYTPKTPGPRNANETGQDEALRASKAEAETAISALQRAWDWIAANRLSVEELPDQDEHGRTYKDGASWGLAYAKRRIEVEQEGWRAALATQPAAGSEG